MLATERSIRSDEIESRLRKTPDERSAVDDPIVAVDKGSNLIATEEPFGDRNRPAARLNRACRELRLDSERKVFAPEIPPAIRSVKQMFRVVDTCIRSVIAELQCVRSGP